MRWAATEKQHWQNCLSKQSLSRSSGIRGGKAIIITPFYHRAVPDRDGTNMNTKSISNCGRSFNA